jgi:hypothetical protein
MGGMKDESACPAHRMGYSTGGFLEGSGDPIFGLDTPCFFIVLNSRKMVLKTL